MSDSLWYRIWSGVFVVGGVTMALTGHPFTEAMLCYVMSEVLSVRAALASK